MSDTRKSIVIIAAAVAVVCISVLMARRRAVTPESPLTPPTNPTTSRAAAPLPPSPPPADPPPEEPSGPPPISEEEARKLLDAARASGNRTGLAAFNPPGTNPPKRGIIVPEGYTLPPGYVRHYQATDGGERLQPILMYHPDYKPLDANGQPLAIPKNRVVPVDQAPDGMPVQLLELPDDTR